VKPKFASLPQGLIISIWVILSCTNLGPQLRGTRDNLEGHFRVHSEDQGLQACLNVLVCVCDSYWAHWQTVWLVTTKTKRNDGQVHREICGYGTVTTVNKSFIWEQCVPSPNYLPSSWTPQVFYKLLPESKAPKRHICL
jgi:hypothetical protein